jgi:hypothetical protein
MLPPGQREDFMRRVTLRLADQPADGAVSHAVNMALDLMVRDEGSFAS